MKNKKFTYFLLVCVAGLWGLIFYRAFNAASAQDTPVLSSKPAKMTYFNMKRHEKDKINLKLDYRNPFSITNLQIEPEISKNSSLPTAQFKFNIPMKIAVRWDAIAYIGCINNPKSNKKLAMLNMYGKDFILMEGQQLNGVKLLKYNTDSVKLQFQNETKFIKLK